MTPREKALVFFLPGLTIAVLGLAWWAIDPKGDARQYLLDQAARLVRIRPIP